MERETLNIWVGAAVLIIVPLLFFIFFTGDIRTQAASGYELQGRYSRVDGVAVGTKVLLTGIPIGQVTKLRFDPEDQQAVLTFSIRDGIKIPRDSVAMIVSDGLLGGKFIKVGVGGELENLNPGDSFGYIQDSVLIEPLLEKIVSDAERNRAKQQSKSK